MRTADQIKRKLHERIAQKQSLETALSQTDDSTAKQQLQDRMDRIEDQTLLLEWVLNEPAGKYHG